MRYYSPECDIKFCFHDLEILGGEDMILIDTVMGGGGKGVGSNVQYNSHTCICNLDSTIMSLDLAAASRTAGYLQNTTLVSDCKIRQVTVSSTDKGRGQ